jgi:hypothetical protein
MMKALEKLDQKEKEQLLMAPVYISLLAANTDGKMDAEEKRSAIEFSQIKTFSSDLLLRNFYIEVQKVFVANLEQLENKLPKGKDERERAINKELLKLEPLFSKLGSSYSDTLYRSFITYAEHVSKAHRSALASFIFPFEIKGFTT